MNLYGYISNQTTISKIYLINRFLYGLKFYIPIWLLYYLNYISISQVGIIESVGFIIGMFLEVPTGAFADIFGRRNSLIIGKLGVSISLLIAVVFNAAIPFVLGIMMSNIMWSFVSGSESALVYDDLKSHNTEKDYAKISSLGNTIFRISIILASFLGGYLYNIWIGLPIFLFAISGIFEAIFWMFAKEPPIDSEKFSIQGFKDTISQGIKQVFKSPTVIYYTFITTILLSFVLVSGDYFNFNLAIDLGLNANHQSILFGITAIIKTITVVGIGYMLIKKSSNYILNTMYLIYILAFLPMIFTNNITGLILLIVIDIFSSTMPIIFDNVLHNQFESKSRATAISVANMISTLFVSILLFLGMKTIDMYGSRIVFSILGVVLIFVFAIFKIYFYKSSKE